MRYIALAILLTLVGCKEDSKPIADGSSPIETPVPGDSTRIEKTPALTAELQSKETIDEQLGLLYEKYEHLIDRSDSVAGRDENGDGIRDDIEAFLNALEVKEPVRNALKQDARQAQKNLYYDFSQDTHANRKKAFEISEEYNKVLACKGFVGISVDDSIDTSETIESLTYNTKKRTMAYLEYNHLLDGSTSIMLDDKEEYCE
ncbi:chromosome partitioning protein ParA [Salinivibrio sp. ML290]|uniref:chromosome partitioning protein ParA n=1 Tax=Salinivibrio sp. ML290 TaxID=1909468 RepID=UPI0009886EDD|nr:chromosome partitioning protein ParA [Salinivibrio sp. ML290]OOE73816.1 chromosome partitioning protein ParA [Salinivibrio sp. ML290]